MATSTIIIFFAVFAVFVTVFVIITRQQRKKKGEKEKELYGGEDSVDAFFKHIENL